ncbi:MAG: DUF4433 domain-containing protein [Bdellovibrionaceae bacterium]|nr:DUF4433 domain-containing protein [Pseudobdellovibrionaceae bacterium]
MSKPLNRQIHERYQLGPACNQDSNPYLVFIRFSLDLLSQGGIVITDGNARSNNTVFRDFQTIADLDILDVAAIRTVKYSGQPEAKRKKQAEILVPDRLKTSQILDFICYDQNAKNQILDISKQFGVRKNVKVNPSWYFGTRGTGG